MPFLPCVLLLVRAIEVSNSERLVVGRLAHKRITGVFVVCVKACEMESEGGTLKAIEQARP